VHTPRISHERLLTAGKAVEDSRSEHGFKHNLIVDLEI